MVGADTWKRLEDALDREAVPRSIFKIRNRRRQAEALRKLLETETALFEDILGRERLMNILRRTQ